MSLPEVRAQAPFRSPRRDRRKRVPSPGSAAALVMAVAACWLPGVLRAQLGFGERIAVETFERMREVERYQLKVAEKYYLAGEFAIAIDEYDKFLTLYEASPGAPYAQLMWSHCQRRLRKVNTAIREGFQSVIDYWPDSEEAVVAGYLMADAYRGMGEVEKAASRFRQVIAEHPDHDVALLSRVALLDLAKVAGDRGKVTALLRELAFETPRTEFSAPHCVTASRELAAALLRDAAIDEAAAALATSYPHDQVLLELHGMAGDALGHLRESDRAGDAEKVAARLAAELEQRIPDDLSAEGARGTAKELLYRINALHAAMGRDQQVWEGLERAARLLGEDDEILGRMADWQKARDHRDAARRIYLRFADPVEGRRRILAMLREEGKWDEAIAACEELVELDPDRAGEYRWAIAECHESAGRLATAIKAYRLVDRFPENYFRMASCHRRLKQFDEAILLYRQVKTAGQAVADADLAIAFTWEEAGRREQAVKAFQLTCRSHPTSGQASRAHAHLQDTYGISITLGGAKED